VFTKHLAMLPFSLKPWAAIKYRLSGGITSFLSVAIALRSDVYTYGTTCEMLYLTAVRRVKLKATPLTQQHSSTQRREMFTRQQTIYSHVGIVTVKMAELG
jgi:hypothetical protein